jgi:hypothetical protein
VDQEDLASGWTIGTLGMDKDLHAGLGGNETYLDGEAFDV